MRTYRYPSTGRKVDDSWMSQAACRGMDTDIFFPEFGSSASEAKAVCAGCCVKDQCLEFSTINNEEGVWGGLAKYQRRARRRRVIRTPIQPSQPIEQRLPLEWLSFLDEQ